MKRKYLTLLLIYSILLCGCPSKTTLAKAKAESARIAFYADEVTNAVRTMFEAKLLSAQQTLKIADKIIILAKGGGAFNALLLALENTYGTVEKIPRPEWQKALAFFNAEVINALITVLTELKFIKDVNTKVRQALDVLIIAVRIIARAFQVEKETELKLAAAS